MNLLGSKTLETNRLILHKTEEKDLKELWNILLLEEVSKYYLTCKIHDNWENEKKYQYKKLEKSSNPDVFCWTIELKDNNEVIGQITLFEKEKEVKDIGWFCDINYQNKGYMYEAALEVLKYAFLEVEIDSIKTCAAIKNEASWHLMEKLGFKRLKTTHYEKYTFLKEKEKVYEYILTKKDFLKEYFRKQELFITIDIDKDPYIKHLSDDNILNITGPSGSGKSTACLKYKEDPNCIVIDTDQVFGKQEKDENNQELYNYLLNKYKEIPDLSSNFDMLYLDILDYYKNSDKFIIIDCATFHLIKDVSILRGDIIILRTCINTSYNRCIERFKSKKKDATFEEIAEYSERKKAMYKWYHGLNNFIDKIDRL